jgi:hypothetical protein
MDCRVKPTAVRFNFVGTAHGVDSSGVRTAADIPDSDPHSVVMPANAGIHVFLLFSGAYDL